ncbi:MAG: hypothetical protein HUU57_00475 [Bdellovibrio sp.]|nr:hypothetical protein [Bdellovibrio sp.]
MQQSTLDSSFVNRLRQILSSRYGKGLQIRQLMDLTDVKSEDAFTKGRDLHIPLCVNGAILGTAVIPSADDLNKEKQQGVTQLVRMVLEPAMYKWHLEQKEANLMELSKANLTLDNVLLFGEEPMPTIDEILSADDTELNEGPAEDLISNLIHLEGRSELTNKKVALQLHEITGRWAFVPFNDIKGQLHSSQDIAKMGAMTIYIENVAALNSAEQELLMDYIGEDRFSDEPLIITSSFQSLEELAATLHSDLLDEVSVNCFEVDRAPLTTQGLREVLELFFMKESPLDAQ